MRWIPIEDVNMTVLKGRELLVAWTIDEFKRFSIAIWDDGQQAFINRDRYVIEGVTHVCLITDPGEN